MFRSVSAFFKFVLFQVIFFLLFFTIITNLRNVPINAVPNADNDDSSSFVCMEDSGLVCIFYGVDPSIHLENVSINHFKLRLESSSIDGDRVVKESAIRATSLAQAYFELGIALSREAKLEIGYFIQSFDKGSIQCCYRVYAYF